MILDQSRKGGPPITNPLRDAVIIVGEQTAFARPSGRFPDIGAVKGATAKACNGQNPGIQSYIAEDIAWNDNAITLDKVRRSGLATTDAARLIRVHDADAMVADGRASMLPAPPPVPASRNALAYGNSTPIDKVAHHGPADAFDGNSRGVGTQRQSPPPDPSRSRRHVVAVAAQQLAFCAAKGAILAEQTLPGGITQRKDAVVVIEANEVIRPYTTVHSLPGLPPAAATGRTSTVGKPSPASDGAAALTPASRSYAQAHGFEELAAIGAAGQVAGPATALGSQPMNATVGALKTRGWPATEQDFIELNGTAGADTCQSARDLDCPLEKTSIHGNAIVPRRTIGGYGARLASAAALELKRQGSNKSAVSRCRGGGPVDSLLPSSQDRNR